MSKDLPALKEKIAKLMAKAEGTDNEHEAMAFLSKAQELMEEHQITWADVVTPEFVSLESIQFKMGSPASVKHELYARLSLFFGCRPVRQVIRHPNGGKTGQATYRVFGAEAAVLTLELMFPYVWKDILRRASEKVKAQGTSDYEKLPSHRTWTKRIAHALMVRVNELVEQRRQKDALDPTEDRQALIVIGDALDAHVRDMYKGRVSQLTTKLKEYREAREIADKISLDRQVGGKEALALSHG